MAWHSPGPQSPVSCPVSTSADLAALLAFIPTDGSTIGNGSLRTDLGWDEEHYYAVKDALVANGILLKGQGSGGTVRLAGSARLPKAAAVPRPRATPPAAAVTETAARPTIGRRTALTKSELYASLLLKVGAEVARDRATVRVTLYGQEKDKDIIGLHATLFFGTGTGIPACTLVLNKAGVAKRSAIFLIDASKGFRKGGPKNRLREQDLYRIVDTFTRQIEIPGFSRLVPVVEFADPKNRLVAEYALSGCTHGTTGFATAFFYHPTQFA